MSFSKETIIWITQEAFNGFAFLACWTNRWFYALQVSQYTFAMCSYREKKSEPQELLQLDGYTVDYSDPQPGQTARLHAVSAHAHVSARCLTPTHLFSFTRGRRRPGRWPGFLQRREGRRHCDLCQRWRAGPDPVGPGHVPGHRPVPQTCPAHSGPEAQLQRGGLGPNGCTHFSVL